MKKIWIAISILIIAVLIVIYMFTKMTRGEMNLGAILVLTGSDARAGLNAKQGIDLALDEINGSGGVRGNKIKMIYEDDQGEPKKAVSAALKLIDIDKVPAIIGPMWSSPVLSIASIAEKKHVVILSPTASSPNITEAGDFIFRNTYSDAFEGSKTAEYVYKKLGYRNIGILYINNDFGFGLEDVFSKRFKEMGGKIVVTESYDVKSTDFRSQLVKYKQIGIDAIYLVGYSEVGEVLKQAKEIRVGVPFISSIMFEISDVGKIAGEAAEGVVYAYVSYDPQLGDSISRTFSQNYRDRYGVFPDPEAAFSYDALKILALVISKVGWNPMSIKDGLYQVKDYHGVTGNTSFDKNGDVVKPIGFKKVENGKYVWQTYRF